MVEDESGLGGPSSSYLCAPETECDRPTSTVADFLGKEAGAWVVLKKEAMLVSIYITKVNY